MLFYYDYMLDRIDYMDWAFPYVRCGEGWYGMLHLSLFPTFMALDTNYKLCKTYLKS